jgi:general secretion pathway protein J
MIFKSGKQFILTRGFTLLELLVALSIFSILSVMAYGGLQSVITAKQATERAADRVAEIQLFMLRVSNDLRQAASRKIRDENGEFLPAMQSGENGDAGIAWTRAGYRNPARLKRSNVKRVAYKLEQKKLIRVTWPVLDRAQDTEAVENELLSNVDSIQWRFLNDSNEWISTWPESEEKAELHPLPKAVEIVFELQDWGKIKRLVLVANDT